ncbi:unnamed protein product [Chironomus riparius]|uniref:Uncharacterized protein n=1 Tax=Chironomus riparius TaxID=315576 RepID=A0A9N9RZK1_9DIPT|nr:unnamed protein product [Chironomus riparius]
MGIKGFYGFTLHNIKDSHKIVNITEEILNANAERPKILIDLHTLSYHFKINNKELLCGYQLNKIKYTADQFFQELKDCGAELIFAFQKVNANNGEFLIRRSDEYKAALKLLDNIQTIQELDELLENKNLNDYPFNVMVKLCLIQTAKNHGNVYGFDSIKHPPSFEMAQFATKEKCSWILGLNTFKFLLPGDWKIWSDEKLNMEKMTVLEINKEAILEYFQINYHHAPLFFTFAEIECEPDIKRKVTYNFGSISKFKTVARFVRDVQFPLTEDSYIKMATRILGDNYPPSFIDDMKKSFEKHTIDPIESIMPKIADLDDDTLKIIKNDFMSFAEEILFNHKPIFFSPVFMDLNSPDMENFNLLVLPLVQKTAGILLKNLSDRETREVVMLDSQDQKFHKYPLEIIYPDFEVPSLNDMLNGNISTLQKMKMLFWIMDLQLSDLKIPCMTEDFTVDCMILMYLVKKNSLTILDARCVLKTIVDTRTQAVPLEFSTDYPKRVNSRALRITFLYSKMYLILNSCLSCIGMKYLCSDLQFDGVYFQKMYSLNVLDEPEEDDEDETIAASANIANIQVKKQKSEAKFEEPVIPNDKDVDQTELVDLFSEIIRL